MARPVFVSFQAGPSGPWAIERLEPVVGESLAAAPRLTADEGRDVDTADALWALQGATSNERYVERPERHRLVEV